MKIIPHLWYDDNAVEAAEFYCSIFENSRILRTQKYPPDSPGPEGTVMSVEWELDGQRFMAVNGGPLFTFNESVSMLVECHTQEEIDHYWERLTEGGEPSMCGWLKDKYGLSWQVSPAGLDDLLNDPDPERVARATKAIFSSVKFDLAAIRAAVEG